MQSDFRSRSFTNSVTGGVTITNVGGQTPLYKTAGSEMRTIQGQNGITVANVGDVMTISSSIAGIGSGTSLVSGSSIKSLAAGSGITISSSAGEVTINSSAGVNKPLATNTIIDGGAVRGISSSGVISSSVVADDVSLGLSVTSAGGSSLINVASPGNLQLKGLTAGSLTLISSSAGIITIGSSLTNAITSGAELLSGSTLRGVRGIGSISSTVNGTDVEIGLTVSSAGTGSSQIASTSPGVLQLKSVAAGSGVSFSDDGSTRTVNISPAFSQVTGVISDTQLGNLVGDVTSIGHTTTISNLANSKLASMPANTIKGAVIAGQPIDLTPSQAKSVLSISNADVAGLGSLAIQNTVNLSTQATGTLQPANLGSMSGDVTNSGYTTTISANSVSNAKLSQALPMTTKGNFTSSVDDVADFPLTPAMQSLHGLTSPARGTTLYKGVSHWQELAPGSLNAVLKSTAGDPAWGYVNLSDTVGLLPGANLGPFSGDINSLGYFATIPANTITNSKAAQMPTLTIKGNDTASTTNPKDLTASEAKTLLAITSADWTGLTTASQEPEHTGDVVNTAGSLVTSISSGVVTNTKLANMPAYTIKGNDTGVSASPKDLAGVDARMVLGLGALATQDTVSFNSDITGRLIAGQVPTFTGDVTSVGGSLTLTIPSESLANTKLAQMPTATIKSNIGASTSSPSDNTLSDILDTISPITGDMLYRTSSGWGSLPIGTTGQYLAIDGSVLPTWTSGSPGSQLSSITAATSANSIDSLANSQIWNWSTATTQTPLTLTAPTLTTGSLLALNASTDGVALSANGRISANVGTTTLTTAQNTTGVINDFLENKIKNTSAGASAQSGFTAESDVGTPTSGFAWMGINSSTFSNPQTYNAGVAGDVTFVGSGNDLILANSNQTKAIKFQTGKATAPYFDDRMTIINNGNIGVNTSTPLSNFDVNGSFGLGHVLTAATTYTVISTDCSIYLTNNGSTQTVTLPAASTCNRRIITLINTGSVIKTVNSYLSLSQAFGNSTSVFPNSFLTLQSDGTTWKCLFTSYQPKPAFSAYCSTTPGMLNNVPTQVPTDVELYDTTGSHSNGTFTAPIDGHYTFKAGVAFNVTGLSGNNAVEIVNNATGIYYSGLLTASGNAVTRGIVTCDFYATAGTTFLCRVRQSSGGTMVIAAGASNTWFMGRLV